MKTAPSGMRGLSLVSWLLILVVVIVFGTAGVRMVPAYLEFTTITGLIENVLADSKVGLKSEGEIRSDLYKRFSINRVESISADDVAINKEGGRLDVSVDYEVRENLFYNVDVVMTFNRDFVKDIR